MKSVICVTENEFYKARGIFEADNDMDFIPAPLAEDMLSALIAEHNAFGCILGVDDYTGKLYESLPAGGIIARFGIGHDGVDKKKATDKSLIVTNTPGLLDDSVAEHTVLLIGSLARNIAFEHQDMKKNNWTAMVGSELKDKTLLIIGLGSIGRKAAKIAAFGFGMNVTGCDIAEFDENQLKRDTGISKLVKDYTKDIGKADFVSIHLPCVPATEHFVDAEFLSGMKKDAFLINTSRGALVDEAALFDILSDKKIAGAALDVFENEPYEPVNTGKDIRKLDNVLLTPHIGSSTIEACNRMALCCIENVKAAYNKDYNKLNILNSQVINKL
jgi:lactate dehydrogenase-like 2-hydroxyacid dehydrogenase